MIRTYAYGHACVTINIKKKYNLVYHSISYTTTLTVIYIYYIQTYSTKNEKCYNMNAFYCSLKLRAIAAASSSASASVAVEDVVLLVFVCCGCCVVVA